MTTRKDTRLRLPAWIQRPGPSPQPSPARPRLQSAFALAVASLAFAFGGCATPGPLHVYSATSGAEQIRDHGNDGATDATREVPSFLKDSDQLTGFAYDPYTDHFFLRLAPGNAIRVVDRPARAIKREFAIEGLPADGAGGDIAIRPRDGHVFFLHPREALVFETTRLGKLLRSLPLPSVTAPALGIAYDVTDNSLHVLHAGGRRITRHASDDGRVLGELTLDRAAGNSLAYDAERREYYAALAGEPGAIGIFDAAGKFLRRAALTGSFVDVGPRSFVRVF